MHSKAVRGSRRDRDRLASAKLVRLRHRPTPVIDRIRHHPNMGAWWRHRLLWNRTGGRKLGLATITGDPGARVGR